MRRIVSILLVLCLMFSLAACGGKGSTDTNGDLSDSTTGSTTDGTSNDTSGSTQVEVSDGGDYSDELADKKIEGNPTTLGIFYRNVVGADIKSSDTDVEEVDKKADAMLKKIEEYPDNITVTGKTYYVSEQGNDNNDGLSSKTPKKTYNSFKEQLKEGDAVLFRRGDIFRGQLTLKSGVTYAAYGSGIKPRFYGSVDGTEGKWAETSTKGVYSYNKSMKYANIIFNNGEAIGRPVQNMSAITKKPLNVYFSGSKLYVYSPKGNPEEVYKSIEIVEDYTLFVGGGGIKNVKLQNLCLMYAGVHFLGTLGIVNGLEIEGCIMGYCGGKDLWQGNDTISLGNCIEFWSKATDIFIHDNYLFQAYDAALTHQGPKNTASASNPQSNFNDFTNIHYENNLLEYNTYDIEAWTCRQLEYQKQSPNGTFTFNDVYIKGNICRYTGWGWGSLDRPDRNVNTTIIYVADGDQDANGNYTNLHVKPLYIENNIFDRARRTVLGISTPEMNKANMILKNNQFLQSSTAKIFADLTLEDNYMTKINEKFTAEGNIFKQVD